MAYHRVEDKINQLSELRLNGWQRGLPTGYNCLDKIFSLKKGYPLFVAGAPHSGKTEFVLDLLLNSSKLHGWKHFIYLGENGEIEEIIAEIAFKFVGKPFRGKEQYAMTESDRIEAEMFIQEHFIFLDDSADYNLTEFYELAKNAEREFGIKFDTTLFDPFNDLKDETALYGGRDDKFLANELKVVRRTSKQNERVDILINHIADIKAIVDKETGNRYTPFALPNEWSGGRTWWRRAFCMIMVYIPPVWLKDENGTPYGENVSLIMVQKAKPKGVANLGACRLFWDWKTNRYYDKSITGELIQLKPNENFVTKDFTQAITDDEAPF